MAYLANTLQSYNQNEPTRKEQVDPDISIMDPVDTPLQMLFGEETVGDTLFYNIVDEINRNMTIAAMDGLALPAGADATFPSAQQPRVKIGNCVQINARQIDVTGTMLATDIHGVVNEMSHTIKNQSLGLGCETEMFLHWGKFAHNPGTQTQTGANVRKTHGLISYIAELGSHFSTGDATSRGLNNGATNAPTVPRAHFPYWYVSDTAVAITPAILFGSIFTNAWRRGMRVNGCLGLMGSALKTAINSLSFGGISANNRDVPADMRAVFTNVDLIDTQWGKVWLMLDRYMDLNGQSQTYTNARAWSTGGGSGSTLTIAGDQALMFLEPSYFKIAKLRARHMEALAKIGDSFKTQIIQELGLKVRNPRAATGGANLIAA
jgi:hypothetical protein